MTTEAEAIAKLARDSELPGQLSIATNLGVIALRDQQGARIVSMKPFIDEYAARPDRITGAATLFDVDSFVAYVNRHKNPSSVVFLDPNRERPRFTGVIDYHDDLAKTKQPESGGARFCRHRANYDFPLSDEWKAWMGANGKQLTQEVFAVWIENHVMDLMDPTSAGDSVKAFANKLGVPFADPARLITLSRGLTVYAGFQMTKVVNLSSGEAQMNFTEEHKDASGAPLAIPGAFVIALPVFRGGTHFQLAVRLRYRVVTGKVAWSFEVYQADRVFDTAIDDARVGVAKDTGLPVFVGAPET